MAQAKVTEAQHAENRRERAALLSLLEHPAWGVLKAYMKKKETERAAGSCQIGIDPVRRSEHVWGYHDAAEFPEWPAKRIEALDKEIARYNRGD